jgi:pyruvate/2-oxoglutarate dehydrogenase complex dihydrolipoamide dehydrogenase (E3) component
MQTYDIIWIGTGQATGTVVPRLTQAGKRVAVVEGGRFGGSCVNYGCTPTKTIVASARAAHMARRGADFGVETGPIHIDFAKVMERQNTIRQKGSQGMESWLRGMEGVTIYDAYASFVDAHTVQVGDAQIWGETIVINAGARPNRPNIPGIERVDWLDNARLLDLTELPEHLVIVGGGYIALEFAQAFRRLGSQVTMLERGGQVMGREDEDVAQIVQDVLAGEGVSIQLNASVEQVAQPAPGQVQLHFTQDGESKRVIGSHLLLAVGRQPNSDRLNLEAAGVAMDGRGYIQVNEQTQTNIPHIYAVGDINGQGAFTHTSVNDGEIFWDAYSGEGDRRLSDRAITYALFVDPPLGRVGMSEKQARASGRKVLMATRPMGQIARAREKDETAGLVKILVDAQSEEFLGATVLGVGGDEIVNMFTTFMVTGQSYKTFCKAVLIHPTVAELMPWILDDLAPLT